MTTVSFGTYVTPLFYFAKCCTYIANETAVGLHVYQKDPPIGVGWVMQGWGESYRGWVGHAGKG